MSIVTRVREKFSQKKQQVQLIACTAVPMLVCGSFSVPLSAAAEGSTNPDISDTLVTSFSDIGSDILAFFGKVLPIALPILGASMVIGIGIAIFKKVTKKSSGG